MNVCYVRSLNEVRNIKTLQYLQRLYLQFSHNCCKILAVLMILNENSHTTDGRTERQIDRHTVRQTLFKKGGFKGILEGGRNGRTDKQAGRQKDK
jgi:hypothetical protein